MKKLMLALSFAGLFEACQDDEAVFKNDGPMERKPPVLDASHSLDAAADPVLDMVRIDFDLVVKSRTTRVELCVGDVSAVLSSAFTLNFPGSVANCGSMQVDLARVLGAPASDAKSLTGFADFTFSDGTMNAATLAGATFDPPRPLLIGPVVQDSSRFAGFKRHSEHQVSTPSLTTSGSFDIEVLDVDATYRNKFFREGFNKVLHWRLVASGFQRYRRRSRDDLQRVRVLLEYESRDGSQSRDSG